MRSIGAKLVASLFLSHVGNLTAQEAALHSLPQVTSLSTEYNNTVGFKEQASTLDKLDASGFLILEPSYTNERLAPLNPENVFGLGGIALEAAAIIELRKGIFNARFRATAISSNNSVQPSSFSVEIMELYASKYVSDRLLISAGKRIISWDPGYSAQPLGFFQVRSALTDLTDQTGSEAGLPLVSVNWLGDSWSTSLVLSDDSHHDKDGERRGLKQWAVRLTRQFGAGDVSFVIQQPQGAQPGYGGAITTVVGSSLSLHFSGFVGTNRLSPRAVFSENSAQIDANNALTFERLADARANIVVGFVFTPTGTITFSGEFVHNGKGYSQDEWDKYTRVVSEARSEFFSGITGLALSNLGKGAELLASSQVRRNYAYFSIGFEKNSLSLSQSLQLGLDDRSYISISQVAYRPTYKWDFSAAYQQFSGHEESEYGAVPIKSQLLVRARLHF